MMRSRPVHAVLAFAAALLVGALPGTLLAQDVPCDSERARRAEQAYEQAEFASVKQLLKACVPAGFGVPADRQEALRLLALTYIAEDSVESARMYVRLLMRENSGFRAREESDPPRLVTLVNDERPPWIAWLWQGGSWQRWLGRAAVVGAAVALPLLLIPDPPPAPLPGPPGLPGS